MILPLPELLRLSCLARFSENFRKKIFKSDKSLYYCVSEQINMNNRELISALSKATGKKNTETDEWLKVLSSILGSTLSNGGSVSVHGFGTFEVKKKEERISVNPVTGKRFLIPPKLIPAFKASTSLKAEIKSIPPEE